jgi:hypothetical protein
MKTVSNSTASEQHMLIPVETLTKIVAGFHPHDIGLSKAWDEFYLACQAASAKPELLQAIHDIKESIEDAEWQS